MLRSVIRFVQTQPKWRVFAVGSVLFTVFLCGAIWLMGWLLTRPFERPIGSLPDDLPGKTVMLTDENGLKVAAWHLPAEHPRGVVILVHGIWNTRLGMLPRARFLHKHQYSTLSIDLHSHGESEGDQITFGDLERLSVKAAVAYVEDEHPDVPVAILGVSLGGAATLLATPQNVDAVILESVFPTIEQAVNNRLVNHVGRVGYAPARGLLWQMRAQVGVASETLRPVDHIAELNCPVFVISGEDDLHTTVADTEQLFEAARQPKELWIVPGAAHVDLYKYGGDKYEQRILAFLEHSFLSKLDTP